MSDGVDVGPDALARVSRDLELSLRRLTNLVRSGSLSTRQRRLLREYVNRMKLLDMTCQQLLEEADCGVAN